MINLIKKLWYIIFVKAVPILRGKETLNTNLGGKVNADQKPEISRKRSKERRNTGKGKVTLLSLFLLGI